MWRTSPDVPCRHSWRHVLAGITAGPSCRQSASLGERQQYLKSARKPVVLSGNLPRSRRRLQSQLLKIKTLSVDTTTRRRKWSKMTSDPDIFGHFVKKIYTSTGNLFVSITSLFPSLRQALTTDIPACRFAKHNAGLTSNRAARVSKRLLRADQSAADGSPRSCSFLSYSSIFIRARFHFTRWPCFTDMFAICRINADWNPNSTGAFGFSRVRTHSKKLLT